MTNYVVRPIIEFANNFYPYHLNHPITTKAKQVVLAAVARRLSNLAFDRVWHPTGRARGRIVNLILFSVGR